MVIRPQAIVFMYRICIFNFDFFSGRKTFQQLKKTSQTRPPPTFQRVSSQRLAKSSSSEKDAKGEHLNAN